MIPYNIRFPSTALSAGALFAALVTAAAKFLFVTEIDFEGYGAGTSSNNEFALYNVSTAGTSSTAATAVPVNPNHPAASFTSFSAYSAQPTKGSIVQNCRHLSSTPLNQPVSFQICSRGAPFAAISSAVASF